MNRLILILLLLGIGIYVYIVLFKNNNYFTNQKTQLISDEYVEQPMHSTKKDRHVHFSEKNTEHLIPNEDENKKINLYDDIFIVDPIEIKNTNLTLSENEYFN